MVHAKPSPKAVFTSLALLCLSAFPVKAAPPAPSFDLVIDSGAVKGAPITDGRLPVASPGGAVRHAPPPIFLGQGYGSEVEPNGTFGTASPLGSTNLVVRANLFPNGDIDFYSFTANAGDRVYAAIMTSFSAGSSTDSQLTLLDQDGTTVIEFDDDNGSFAALSSTIAGAIIPANGTYFLKVNDFTAATTTERGYELHLRVQSGSPTPEVEPNDTPATANVLPANGWVSGARNPAAATEQDWYSLSLNAGDTVFLSLDVDPEDDLTVWNGRLGFALFGDAGNQILVIDDAGTGDVSPLPNRPSEALFMTVKNSGTYYAFVDSASAATGGPTATYQLSVSVHPAANEGVNCTTYSSTDVPKTIGPGTGLVSSTITVPGNPRIADIDVELVLNHAVMGEIDAHLRSPAGNDNGLFTDIGAAAAGGQAQMDVVFDDEAGVPPSFTSLKGTQIKPELAYRLAWFDGENAGGVWTLDLRDDTAGANGGTLTAWSLRICEPPPPPTCAPGFTTTTVFTTDFESGAAGFTHSGTADEWALGTPNTVATTTTNPVAGFTTCNSGVNCWKTDLTGTYNVSSSQDLLSPNINLAGLSAPVVVSWAQKYQFDSASFDHAFVDFQQVGGATPVRLWDWLDATMINAPGNPAVNVPASSGWSILSRRADSLAGLNTEARFHLDSDAAVVLGGLAIDDVTVTACRPLTADLAITKTDGVTTAVPGGSVTYTITASNSGSDPVTGATVADTFPAALTCSTTCVGAGGGTCTAGPTAGNLNDLVNLPVGGSVTYTASCTISAAATGLLSNTATVSSSVTDPVPGNNSATDTDILDPQADVAITKTDGSATEVPGTPVTYTIVASNAGPSNASSANVADTFPASLSGCSTTCVGAGGATCTAGPTAGNISDAANLPAGGSVTYTATCNIAATATGSLANTATAILGGGVTDPTPGNNSATDTDTLDPQADVAITKTDGSAVEVPGTPVTYTIVASNAGPSAAPSVLVADTFAGTLSGCSTTCVGAGGASCTAGPVAGNLSDTANLPVGGSVTYTATCNISGAATGTLVNTATATTQGGVTDPTPANNSATDTDTLGGSADVAITKTDGATTEVPGTTVTYTIVASNAGPSAAPSVLVADTFAGILSGCSTTCVGAGGASCTAGPTAGNLSDTANLPIGGSVTYTATCTVAANATGSLVNTATATTQGGTTDPVPGNNSATDTDTLNPDADLAISKTDGQTNSTAGQPIVYTIVASNAGPSSVTGATVADTFAGALTGVTWTCVGAGGGTCTAAGAGNINDLVNLPVGGSATYTVNATISNAFSGTLSNTATVAAPGGVSDPVAGNNSATDTTTVAAAGGAMLVGTKTVAGNFVEGGLVTYTIVITNNGSATQGDNPGNEFTDTLPAGLTLVSALASSGTVGTAGNTVTWDGSLAPAAAVTITIDATIDVGTTGAQLVNQGTLNYDSDNNGSNDATGVTDDPSVPGGGDGTGFGVGAPIVDIPALSGFGFWLLGLALAIAGLRYLYGRS